MKSRLRTMSFLYLLVPAACLTVGRWKLGSRTRPSFFMSDSLDDSPTTLNVQASSTFAAPAQPKTTNPSTNSSRRRRKQTPRRPPAVDSTLLRFIGQQKESLIAPELVAPDLVGLEVKRLPVLDTPAATGEPSAVSETRETDTVIQQSDGDLESVNTTTTDQKRDEEDTISSWWGQYNSHRIESVLLSMDSNLDSAAVTRAGARVQSQVLARTVRRRIRTFLKERDKTWKSDLALTIGSVGDMIGYSGDHSFEESVQVMMDHGLTAKDITDILQHTPGVVLMRPRADPSNTDESNGECLCDTIDRVFKLLCVTLKLRKYDARKIVRASPGLLTMRGSKSALAVVSLLSRMGVSTTAVARDKVGLTVLLSRSPAALFRLVSFLASDAIRMPVANIGPLLRRPLSRELLDAVAPVPSLAAASMDEEDAEGTSDELDPWIASALWGQQSQLRRDRINEIYQNMTKTAWTLRNEIGAADLSKVVSGYPSVLLLDAVDQILPNADYLMDSLGILEGDLPRVLQLYPVLLGLPIERMDAVSDFLLSLGISDEELSSVFRAFPALLTLDIEEDMEPVVQFLLSIGVIDVGRFITRIPPILGYSVERELVPKWQHLQLVSSDPRFEVTKFPAFFSYPLERVIKARYEYIRNVKKFPSQLLRVDRVLSYGDRDFAVKVLREKDEGRAFRRFLEQRTKALRPTKTKRRRQRKKRAPKGSGDGPRKS